jgi:hypothetical protein
MQNPYPTRPDLGLRVHLARKSLENFGRDYSCRPTLAALTTALRCSIAINGNDNLKAGIERTGKNVWPQWLSVYNAPATSQLSSVAKGRAAALFCLQRANSMCAKPNTMPPTSAPQIAVRYTMRGTAFASVHTLAASPSFVLMSSTNPRTNRSGSIANAPRTSKNLFKKRGNSWNRGI